MGGTRWPDLQPAELYRLTKMHFGWPAPVARTLDVYISGYLIGQERLGQKPGSRQIRQILNIGKTKRKSWHLELAGALDVRTYPSAYQAEMTRYQDQDEGMTMAGL